MHTLSVKELRNKLDSKEISSVELTETFLNRIESLNPNINALITVTKDKALSDAKKADEQISQGKQSYLTGIPLIQKDIFCTKDIKTSAGSKMLDNFISPYDATVVKHCSNAGTVLLGKANMDEFAMGSSNENSYYGAVKNPWNLEATPGGSSGGSAAAIAAGFAPIATGTDTGGSIRQPAGLCGISGLKPTYGRVSRYGMIAFASSLDQGGPMAKSAEDLAYLLNAMAGYDIQDSTSVNTPTEDYTKTLNQPLDGLTIGLPKEYFTTDLDSSIASILENAISTFKKLGATFKEISLKHSKLALPAYYIIAPSECSSNLARYDGVRYGHRAENPNDLVDLYKRSRSEGFGDEVKRRIMIGTYALSSGYYDAYYAKAQKIRRLISEDFNSAFDDVDLIFAPTSPSTAFKLGEKSNDPVSMYLSDIYTIPVNLAGLPAISIPAGFHNNLPVGLQLIGNLFKESQLLNAAHQFQLETDHHLKTPAL
ncbi:Asp-tRNA(Asn)/Glu-tRNA(Gln) amidotransferase subunit GatA [Thiotrichales bacterium 19S11-10]|nr:Asp-tRNA(Asn)/Glu-tRNA(Gln) amidotransferase subunit GatA [Thiotrichales bacterium 19S11-10]MCF6808204.1 Asp-tRNA(Asn)/Glu-tRNA(Gln) amidotransferase subunit GatA [Thiotrichales bacterium 19S9-11]MCF6812220.1 Asp-tRNA(Asn)/Glu-tRNA(Gln) amidotransferase subunit GatA [Thiotrichales bacterium 19S9-12]